MSFLGNLQSNVEQAARKAGFGGPAGGSTTGPTRFLDPRILGRISDLQLVARSVVEGFLTGLHRSPFTGVSIEFAEYRLYTPGDDPRSIDWNVFARSDRHYQKKYHGETNTELTILLDVSASMGFGGNYKNVNGAEDAPAISKYEYGCYLAASLAYFASQQRDATGLILFDSEIRERIPARMRRGQLPRILHALDNAKPGQTTNLAGALDKLAGMLHRRGVIVLISDFYEQPEKISDSLQRLRFGGNDLILFHLMDPLELEFNLDEPVLLEDLETGDRMEVNPEYAGPQYRKLIEEHIGRIGQDARSARIDYELVPTSRPLDYALFHYLSARQRRG
ncbi:MAG: DUF58 domain-containing protein [Acidobacteria bacterium]|nr:DUF58 domain-containing protein [Acidobacteriota bacterium]